MPLQLPPPGFHFRVEVLGLDRSDDDLRFTEVGGLAVELQTEEVAEGGENRFVQRYPVRAKYAELSCKRGLMRRSPVFEWAVRCIEHLEIEPMDVEVTLLNAEHEPLMAWHVVGAYPTKWSVSDLNAQANAFVVESLQLAYQRFSVDKG